MPRTREQPSLDRIGTNSSLRTRPPRFGPVRLRLHLPWAFTEQVLLVGPTSRRSAPRRGSRAGDSGATWHDSRTSWFDAQIGYSEELARTEVLNEELVEGLIDGLPSSHCLD